MNYQKMQGMMKFLEQASTNYLKEFSILILNPGIKADIGGICMYLILYLITIPPRQM
mgnify:CR=1 FL=1